MLLENAYNNNLGSNSLKIFKYPINFHKLIKYNLSNFELTCAKSSFATFEINITTITAVLRNFVEKQKIISYYDIDQRDLAH